MTRILPTLALLLAAAPMALAAEADVSIDRNGVAMAGTLNLPDGAENPPVVLMLHGFTGSRNEFPVAGGEVGLFAHAAATLAEAGIASLRIDFVGSGESGGAWEDTTFSSQIADAVAAFDHLQALDGVDGARVASSATARAASSPPTSPACARRPTRSCSGRPSPIRSTPIPGW